MKAAAQLLSCGVVYYTVKGDSKILSLWIRPKNVPILMKATEQYFHSVLSFILGTIAQNGQTFVHIYELQWRVIQASAP